MKKISQREARRLRRRVEQLDADKAFMSRTVQERAIAILQWQAHANALRDALEKIAKRVHTDGCDMPDLRAQNEFVYRTADKALASTPAASLAALKAEVGLRVLTAVGYVEPSTGADFDECKRRGREDVPMLNQVGRERAVARALAAQAATHSVPGGTSEVKP